MQFLGDLKILLEAEKVYPFKRTQAARGVHHACDSRSALPLSLQIRELCGQKAVRERGVLYRGCVPCGRGKVRVGPCLQKFNPPLPVSGVVLCLSESWVVISRTTRPPHRCFSTQCAGSSACVLVVCHSDPSRGRSSQLLFGVITQVPLVPRSRAQKCPGDKSTDRRCFSPRTYLTWQ